MDGFVIAQVYQCWILPRSSFLYHSTCRRSFIYLRTDQRYVLSQFNMSLFHLRFWCLVFFVPLNFLSLSTVWKHSTVKCGRLEITIFKKIIWIFLGYSWSSRFAIGPCHWPSPNIGSEFITKQMENWSNILSFFFLTKNCQMWTCRKNFLTCYFSGQ